MNFRTTTASTAAREPLLPDGAAVQAALDGSSVALIADMLVAEELAAGHLVRPFDTAR